MKVCCVKILIVFYNKIFLIYGIHICTHTMNTNVTIYRIGQIGELSVDFRRTVQDSSPGDATQLNFYPTSVVYLGEVLIL